VVRNDIGYYLSDLFWLTALMTVVAVFILMCFMLSDFRIAIKNGSEASVQQRLSGSDSLCRYKER
jgi:hypothetical protein